VLDGVISLTKFQFGDRRQNSDTPSFPFKDSNGATVRECRREIPDRRINSIKSEWIDEVVIR
jgi:hypothetical protein